jgi:hypothetical protein
VTVIPYPIGGTAMVERPPTTWERGSVCYLGRLEPRKGVIEWVDAAVSVAPEHPGAVFDFVGADLPFDSITTVQELLTRRIPEELRPRFRFHGGQPRAQALRFLADARLAVVPSRWENFPNTCIEAMCSGLPVIVSPNGGMAELVEDGRTGWVAPRTEPAWVGLGAALRRSLLTPAGERAAMGRAAAIAVRRICDNSTTVARQLAFRADLARRGAGRSLALPRSLPWSGPAARRARRTAAGGEGVTVIVTGDGRGPPGACLAALRTQTRPPLSVTVVPDGRPEARNEALAAARRGRKPLGVLFLDAADLLRPEALAALEAALRHRGEVGLVSSWGAGRRWPASPTPVTAPPSFPYQWMANEVAAVTAFRLEAVEEAGGFRPGLEDGLEEWDLVNAILAAGWPALTYPAILGERTAAFAAAPGRLVRARTAVLERFPELVAADAAELVLLLEARCPGPDVPAARQRAATVGDLLRRPWREQVVLARAALREPRRAADWVLRRATSTVRQGARRGPARDGGATVVGHR